ncbi:MAG TPA: class III lanthionine synthetase LanKC, partial [Thermoanaerobaculia bacterium]|nr:class III lanthionine synthetase LanKC [Thermoanaerobaculia bacterium]
MLVESDHLYLYASAEYYEPVERYDASASDFLRCVQRIVPSDWRMVRSGVWFATSPPNAQIPPQGWKIHISATPANAAPILTTVARSMVRENVSFKFSADQSMLVLQNSKRWARGGAGKFITIYPRDEAECGRLLESLYKALVGYRGPFILSDRRYRDSGVVFYRYGGLQKMSRLDVTGRRIPIIRDAEGQAIDDERSPYFHLPPTVRDPFSSEPDAPESGPGESPTLRDGRYTIHSAITFSNSGGVYLCTDHQSGDKVIIKEARPLTNSTRRGPDAVWTLKKEHRLLMMLEDLQIAPRPIEMFQEWEHFYLVESLLDGVVLRGYMARHLLPLRVRPSAQDVAEYVQRFCRVYARIADMIGMLHERRIVFSDISHYNVMVAGDADEVRLIDFEGAYEQDVDIPTLLFTPGFTTREVLEQGQAQPEDDLFGLGGLMLAGLLPVNSLMSVDPVAGIRFLDHLRHDFDLPQDLIDVPRRLLSLNRAERPKATVVAEALRRVAARADHKPRIRDAGVDPQTCPEILDGIVSHLVASADYARIDRLFPADPAVFETNPLSLGHGACGVAYALKTISGSVPEEVLDWMRRHELSDTVYPPGLYSGLSGIAWTLLEIGLKESAHRLLGQARRHPLLWESPDVFYGAAGYGMTELRFFLDNGDRAHLDHAVKAAEYLLRTKIEDEHGASWTAQDTISCSFAHGVSGIGYFLLALHGATGDERWLDLARRGMDFIAAKAVEIPEGGISWRAQEGRPTVTPYWRWGSSGVGMTLLRYQHVTGETRFDDLFRRMTLDCDRKYAIFPGRFFGLSGVAEFCLDWARFVPHEADEAMRQARKALDGALLFRVKRDSGIAFPGETLSRISCDYGTGSAGIGLT